MLCVEMGWGEAMEFAGLIPSSWAITHKIALTSQSGKTMEHGPELQKRNNRRGGGGSTLRITAGGGGQNYSSHQPTQMPRASPQKPSGVEIRPRRLLFRPGNSRERLVLEKAQGLQPDR